MRGIFKRPDSQYWFTSIKTWDESTGKWKWRKVSTQTTDEVIALATRKELQRVADEAVKHAHSGMTRQKALEAVNLILQWHGVPEVQDSENYAETWHDAAESLIVDLAVTNGKASARQYQTHLRKFTDHIGDGALIAGVSARQVQDFYNDLVNSGLSPTTAKAYLKSIRRVFSDAVDDGRISINPAKRIKTKVVRKRKKEPFSPEDLRKIFEGVKKLDYADEWRLLCFFGLCLGARINDCSVRKWSEITIDGTPHIAYEPGKTAAHAITVKAPLVNPLLASLIAAKAESKGEQFITPTLAAIPASGRDGLSGIFMQLLDDAGVKYRTEEGTGKGIAWKSKGSHSFRHTLPSLLSAANVPAEIRMGIVGHSRIETHLGYTHHDDEAMRGALEGSLKGFVDIG